MSYEFIQDYSHYQGGGTVSVAGRTLPSPALVEDDSGVRYLLTHFAGHVNASAWLSAQANGAAGIVHASWDYSVLLVEDFMEMRTEEEGTYVVDPHDHRWVGPFDHPPTYAEIMHARMAPAPRTGSFVHLHAHSEHSPLDGLSSIEEMVDIVAADNQPALAVTDHGVCSGLPALSIAAAERDIKPLFGIEAYFVDDRRFRPPERPVKAGLDPDDFARALAEYDETVKRARDYWHLVLWAQNDEGLMNLFALASESHTDESRYYKPRMDWDSLERYSSGLYVSTACLRGPLSGALLRGDDDLARYRLSRLNRIFDGRVRLELHTNQLPEQIELNKRLVELGNETSTPYVVVSDSHYPTAEHQYCHQVWMAIQTDDDLKDDPTLFAGNQDYHLLTSAEVSSAIDYLGPDVVSSAMSETLNVADSCDAVLRPLKPVMAFSKTPGKSESELVAHDIERLTDLCLSNWSKTQGKTYLVGDNAGQPIPFEVYAARFEKEMALIIEKGFAWYFLMVADYCDAAKDGRVMMAWNGTPEPIIVGPGRGSGGGCLVAYLANIVEIDPVEADLMFERFMTKGRKALPDFDIDFPASKRDPLTSYVQGRYGKDRVVRIGTHIHSKNKGIIRDLARVLKDRMDLHYPHIDAICQIIDDSEADTAGLGKKWEAILEDEADLLAPYISSYPELFDLAGKLAGRLKSYGKHPAGLVISTEESLIDKVPLFFDGDVPVTMYDMETVEALQMVKFDLLTLRTFDTLQTTLDLIRERHGNTIDLYSWRDEYKEPEVWDLMCEGHTLGLFQVETPGMTRLTMDFQPRTLSELADVVTLIRPGPKRSGLTDTYLRRKKGEEPVSYPHEVLKPILAKSYGCILYQEDVMQACMLLAGYDEDEADAVRKLLGKKQVEKVMAAGEKFRRACHEQGVISDEGAAILWDQMAEFAKYSFNRAHAYAYAVIAYWCAWFKYHYPAEFLVGVLSHVDGKRIPDFVTEARRRDFKVLPPDINSSGRSFTIVADDEVRYGLGALAGIGDAVCDAIIPHQPFTSFEDFLERKGGACNSGHIKTLASVGAFDSLVPNRRALEAQLDFQGSPEDGRCRHKDESYLGPNGLPCRFDWDSVPVELTKTGKPKKNQRGAPKKCTKGCWKYDPNDEPEFAHLEDYTSKEIREREREVLGVYLSSTPFEVIPPDGLAECYTGAALESATLEDTYLIAGIIERLRKHTDRTGREMAFLGLGLHDGSMIDVVVFASLWNPWSRDLYKDRLILGVVRKTERGYTLTEVSPI